MGGKKRTYAAPIMTAKTPVICGMPQCPFEIGDVKVKYVHLFNGKWVCDLLGLSQWHLNCHSVNPHCLPQFDCEL